MDNYLIFVCIAKCGQDATKPHVHHYDNDSQPRCMYKGDFMLLPARASEQGNVIGSVSVYICICTMVRSNRPIRLLNSRCIYFIYTS